MEYGAHLDNLHGMSKYPVDDGASLVDDSGNMRRIPLVGVIASSMRGSVSNPFVSSVHIGSGMVSASVSDDSGCVFLCNVPLSSFEPYRPYGAMAVRNGVSAFVAFDDITGYDKGTFKFSSAAQSGLLESCFVEYRSPGVSRFIDPKSGESISGDVSFKGNGKVAFEMSGPGVKAVLTDAGLNSLLDVCGSLCNRNGNASQIKSINGVKPDSRGDINIRFIGIGEQ